MVDAGRRSHSWSFGIPLMLAVIEAPFQRQGRPLTYIVVQKSEGFDFFFSPLLHFSELYKLYILEALKMSRGRTVMSALGENSEGSSNFRQEWWKEGQCRPDPLKFYSKADASHAGVRKEGSDGPVALCPSNHVSDLTVELSETVAYLRQVLFGTDKGKGSRLTQSLVPEIDVE